MKAKTLKIAKWRESYITIDRSIPELEAKQIKSDERYREEHYNEGGMFSHPGLVKFRVIVKKDLLNKLPDELKVLLPKYPKEIILKDVYYSVVNDTVFINFFSEAKLVDSIVSISG